MKLPNSLPVRRASGFSLIEVTIAMAIVAVAVVSLLGMLPRGMQTMRQAGDQAIYGRINQQVLSELQLTDWNSRAGGTGALVQDYHLETRYYDDQGVEVEETEDRSQVYTARIHVPTGPADNPDSVGGGTMTEIVLDPNSGPSPDVRVVVVEVAADSRPDFDFDDPDNLRLITVFQTTLARLGRDYDR